VEFKKQKNIGEKKRGKPRNRLLTIENKLMVTGGKWVGGWVKQAMGIKEDTYDEHRVSHASDEPPNPTPETNIVCYIVLTYICMY